MFSSNTTQVSSGGYQISRSLRFNSADSAYLNRTPASAGSRTTWTWSGWVKRGGLVGDYFFMFGCEPSDGNELFFGNTNNIAFYNYVSGVQNYKIKTTATYRDPSAWYHIVFVWDTTNSTSGDRIRLYVNGSRVTSFSEEIYPAQNTNSAGINTTNVHTLGSYNSGSYNVNGLMTETYFIDGQALTPSSFGETNAQTGVWQPKAYSGSYGTNGFYINFSDNSNTTAATLGKDYSGNGNNWTPNNFSVTAGAGNDSLVDSPTSFGTDTGVGGTVRGNYCTLNPLIKPVGTVAYSNGNLVGTNSTANWNAIGGTIGISTGKWYWEYISGGQNTFFGIQVPSINFSSGNPQDANAAAGSVLLCDDNQYQIDYNSRVAYTGTSHPSGTIVGVAVDMDAGTIVFYLNGTSQGSITWTSSAAYGKTVIPMAIAYDSGYVTTANFGQRPFAYTAPSGFKALCTQNLPTPTIGATTATQAGKFFSPLTYTATGNDPLAVTGVGFQPDFVWIKSRSAARDNVLFDAVRGATKYLLSNSTGAEGTNTSSLKSFDSDGFTLGTWPPTNWIAGDTQVSWNWKANGSGSTNTAGSITSTVSANTTSGFSVVTYTGTGANATVGHGLGVAPSFIIVKRRDAGSSWNCYQISLGASQYIQVDGTGAAATNTGVWNNTAPTSSVFSIGTAFAGVNASGSTHVAYCFAPIAGYSAFGSYTGNGSTDGAFVYTGFRPAYVLIKRTTSAYDWWILDAARGTINAVKGRLYANSADAESTTYPYLDFLSNGFKLRDADGGLNASGEPYIYACFAQNPFKYSLAR